MAAVFFRRCLTVLALLLSAQGVALLQNTALASDAVCAEVRIEIRQKLNLERQAFDAVLRIRNGLAASDIEALSVNVLFQDALGNPVQASSDPNQTSARFFVRLDSLEGVNAVDGTGRVASGSLGVARWLIIPSASAAGSSASGQVYRVGARVTYRIGGEDRSVEVVPETITVRPQPRLRLDYFLAGDVYSDDPFTPSVESPEPFTFGVRVRNVGAGPARALRIESAQPRIVENRQGLLVDFRILGGRVDDASAAASLRLDLGDIDPGRARMGRWLMQTSLSGQFVDIEATYTHADTLGGALTSLIEGDPASHLLVGDVLVDLPGRDGVRDFLARDADVLRVYESNGPDTEVQDLSASASVAATGSPGQFRIQLPPVQGLVYARLTDPSAGASGAIQATRADGSALPGGNIWRSRSRDANLAWNYYINVFDTRGGGTFTARTDLPPSVSSLSGSVYVDANGNGNRDAGELAVEQASILLDGLAAGAQVQRSALSQTDGSFVFADLPAGTYTLAVGAVSGLTDGVHRAGSAGGQVGPAAISGIVLAQAQSAEGYIFAKREPSAQPREADLRVAAPQGPAEATAGELISLMFRASNRGPEAALARSRLQLPESFEIESVSALSGQFEASTGVWAHGSLATGAEHVLTLSGRFTQAGPVRIAHAIELTDVNLSDPNGADNQAQLDLRIAPAPGLQLDFELARQSRVLLWSDCASGSMPTCAQSRRARWQSVLGADANGLLIAATPSEFRRMLRLGEFNAVLIDGPIGPLSGHINLDELGEVLRRGSALILSGARDSAWAGIEARGGLLSPVDRPGASALVEFSDSEAFAAGTSTVQGPLRSYPGAGAQVLARYPDDNAALVRSGREGVRLLGAGFDLLQLLETAPSAERARRLLAGLASVPRLPVDTHQRVPLRARVDRAAGGGDLDLQLSWPSLLGVEAVRPAPTSQSSLAVRWTQSLAAASLPFEAQIDLRAGSSAGTAAVLASASLDADAAARAFELQIVAVADRFDAALAGLNAVPAAGQPEQQALARARAQLQAARQAAESQNPWAAIEYLLQALRELDSIAAAEARHAQRALSDALAAVARAASEPQGEAVFADSFEAPR